MRIGLLGPVELVGADGVVPLGGPKERAVLAHLALHRGDAVSSPSLVDAVWPDDPPRTANRTLQGYVSRLRGALDRAEPGGGALLESGPMHTRLRLPPEGVDVALVEKLLAQAAGARERGDPVGAALALADAMRCWRGEALAELAHLPWAAAAALRFGELRLHVLEERIDAELATGRAAELVAELEGLCRAHPLRERLWALRMLALYRAGRQVDALRAFQELQGHLRNDLGLDPSPALVALEQQILSHDPMLEVATEVAALVPHHHASRRHALPRALQRLRDDGFVGREDELASLRQTWSAVCGGRTEVVLVSGEPGIGKTALVAEHAAELAGDGARVLFGRCDEESLVPFQPFVEAIAEHIETTDPDVLRAQLGDRAGDLALLVPELARMLPEAEAGRTGAETERYRMFEAVPALLGAIASSAPVMLVIDDLHWAERPTLQLLQHLARHGSVHRLLVLGTYRDTDLSRSHPLAETLAELRRARLISRLPVRGLLEDDVVALVTGGGTPEDRDRELAASLWSESEGSPLFVREILRHLEETGAIATDAEGRWRATRRIGDLGMPEGIREVIGRRLSRLSDLANATLLAGSVMGAEVRIDAVAQATDLDPDAVLDALEEATAAGLVREVPARPGIYVFGHALVRQALYSELSLTRRVRLHERIGDSLLRLSGDDGRHLPEIAHHYLQAAVTNPERAVTFAVRAAEQAAEAVAYEDAVRLLTDALEVIEDSGATVGERADLLLRIGELSWSSGTPDSARAAYERVIALVGPDDPVRFGRAALGISGGNTRAIWVNMGTANERAVEVMEQALDLLPDDDSVLRARLLAALGRELHYRAGTDRSREELSHRGLAMIRRLGDLTERAHVLCASMLATYGPDTMDERRDHATEALEIARSIGDPQLEGHAAMHRLHALAELGRFDEAFPDLECAEELLTRLRDPVACYLFPAYRGGWATLTGDIENGMARMREAFQAGHDRRDSNALIVYGGSAIISYLYQRRLGELLAPLHQLIELFPLLAGTGWAIEAAVSAEAGALDRARAAAAHVDAVDIDSLRRDPFFFIASYGLARALWLLGDAERARTLRDILAPYAECFAGIATVGFGPMHTALAWTNAAAGDLDAADAHFGRTLDIATRWGWRTVICETNLHRAVNRRERGDDPGEWQPLLDEAEAIATDIGLDAIADEARAAATGDRPSRLSSSARRRDRAKAAIVGRARNAVAQLIKDDDDETLARRFGSPRAQRTMFGAMTAAYQPSMALGFEGEIEIELTGVDDLHPIADVWTLEIRERGVTATPRPARSPTLVIHSPIPEFLRIAAGVISPTEAIIGGLITVEGDVVLAARVPYLFGIANR